MSEKVFVTETTNYEGKKYKEGEVYDVDPDVASTFKEMGHGREPEPEELDMGVKDDQIKKIENLKEKLEWDDSRLNRIIDKEFGIEDLDEATEEEADKLKDIMERQYAKRESEEDKDLPDSPHSLPSGKAGQKAALKMEKKDEKQIVEDMSSVSEATLDEYFYEFPQKGKMVTGPSYIGIMAMMREHENIHVEILEDKEREDHFYVKVRAEDEVRNTVIERSKRQPKKMEKKDGSKVKDKFAATKAQSKAIKKAVKALLPDEVITQTYADWKEKQKGKK